MMKRNDISSARNPGNGMTHAEQRATIEWQKKKSAVYQMAGWRCEDCGRKDLPLDAHHTVYLGQARKVWDYPHTVLMSLCRPCHEWRQGREDAFRLVIGEMTRVMKPAELEAEVWRLLDEIRARWAAVYASSFAVDETGGTK